MRWWQVSVLPNYKMANLQCVHEETVANRHKTHYFFLVLGGGIIKKFWQYLVHHRHAWHTKPHRPSLRWYLHSH